MPGYKIETRNCPSLSPSSVSHRRESSQTTSARCSPVDIRGTLTKWRRKVGRMRRGVRLTRRRCAEKKNVSRSGTKWSIHFFQSSRQTTGAAGRGGEGLKKEMRKTDERRKDIRHLRGKTEWHWMVLKPAPVRQTCGNCASIKRFPDATPYTSNYRGNPPGGICAHSILIGRSPRGYLYSAG